MQYNPYYLNYNPGYAPNYMAPQINRLQQLENQYPIYNNAMPNNPQNVNTPMMIQGKAVDSIDVVKAMDVPLDGSVTYFPKTDGSAIFTKQLLADGTSKINIYELNNKNNTKTIENNNIVKPELEKIREDLNNLQAKTDANINIVLQKIDELALILSQISLTNSQPENLQNTSNKTNNSKTTKGVK